MTVKRFNEGDVVYASGDMCQMAYYIAINAENTQDLKNKIRFVDEHLLICDENGNNMKFIFSNIDEVL